MTSCVTCTKNPSCGFCGGAVQACLDGTAGKVRPVFTAAQLCCVTLCGCAPCCFDAPLMQLYLQLFGCCAIRAPTLARLAVEHPGTMAPAKPRKAAGSVLNVLHSASPPYVLTHCMHLCRVCSGATSCDECRVLDSCGWCADSDTCLVGTDAGASDGSCAASGGDDDAANNWWRGSCPAGCSQLLGYSAMSCLLCTLTSRPLAHTHTHTHTHTHRCSACTDVAGCGWCAPRGECQRGDATASHNGACTGQYWKAETHQCWYIPVV